MGLGWGGSGVGVGGVGGVSVGVLLGVGVCPGGVCFDNVRGYSVGGGYVGGDRGVVLRGYDLVGFERVSYAEFVGFSGGEFLRDLGQLVIYFKCGYVGGRGGVVVCSDRVEWRPPEGLVKALGLARARVVYGEVLLRGLAALLRVVREVIGLKEMIRVVRRELGLGSAWAREVLGALCGGGVVG